MVWFDSSEEYNVSLLINARVTEFFMWALQNGYDYDGAWKLLLNSKQGQSILNNTCDANDTGMGLACQANGDIGHYFNKPCTISPDEFYVKLLAEFISMAYNIFHIQYEYIFSMISLNEFMKKCGNVLGNYDDKLIKIYILGTM